VSASGGRSATLTYDPLGRLWQVSSPITLTRLLYDGDRLAIEYDAFGSVLRAYDHGTGADEPLVWYEAVPGGTSRRYLHADHQGSIVAVTDQNGNPIAINAYDAWGIPNSGNLGRFGYTGQAWLAELGMWYYKARVYSPTLGRFLQTDPVGYKDQVNLYAYVGNDPVDGRDPLGLYVTSPQDRTVVGKVVANLRLAAERSRMQTGSRLPSHASNVLNAFVKALGKQDENNGITIQSAKLDEGTLGDTTMSEDGSQTIRMDFGQISKIGGYPIGAAVLGHEMTHVAQNRRNGEATTLNELYRREIPAYEVGSWVMSALGWHSSLLPSIGDAHYSNRIRDAAKDDCLSAEIGYEDAHHGREMLPGNCD
jgi:RHS repeat-associated protein